MSDTNGEAPQFQPQAIGFIGLGAMGYPMATVLRKKLTPSIPLYIYDTNPDPLHKLSAEFDNIIICSSSKEVGEKSETVLTIVPNDAASTAVYKELSQCNPLPKLMVDASTISPSASKNIASFLPSSTTFIDTPVSGGTSGALAGTLTFMLGCPHTHPLYLHYLYPFLSLMGKNIIPCGAPSLGLVAKLSNNYCSGLIAIATSEAMNIGMRAGLDKHVLSEVFSRSTAGSWVNDKCNPVPGVTEGAPAGRGYEGGFRVELMRKDFNLALGLAEEVGAKTVLGTKGEEVWREVEEDERCRGKDARVVYRWVGGAE